MTPPRPALFLDRDGVIIEEVGYLCDPDLVQLIPRAAEAIARVNEQNVPVIVATNQAGVGRGYYPEARVAEVHAHLDALLARHGAHIDRYYYCPHHPSKGIGHYRCNCACRKPQPGMLFQAAAEWDLDLSHSYLVGDKLSDLEAAQAAKCHGILAKTGYGQGVCAALSQHGLGGTRVVDSLVEAVEVCLPQLTMQQRAA